MPSRLLPGYRERRPVATDEFFLPPDRGLGAAADQGHSWHDPARSGDSTVRGALDPVLRFSHCAAGTRATMR